MSLSREKRSTVFLMIIIILFIGVGCMVFLYLRTSRTKESIEENQILKTLMVLCDDDGNSLATDILVYYPTSKKGAMFDILGYTGGIYKSIGRVDRIDSIYKEKGINTYKSEIETLTDTEIPFTLEISLDNLEKLTDLFGGMKFFVPFPVDVKVDDNKRWLLPSGAVTLDGEKVRVYTEYLLPSESVSDQEERRQNVMVAFLNGIKENKSDILKKSSFRTFSDKLKVNVDNDTLYTLLESISDIDTEHLTPQYITGSLRAVDGQTLLFPYYNGQLIKDVVRQTLTSLLTLDEVGQSRVYVLNIENGTLTQGLARNTSALLQSAGYDVLGTGNADTSDYEHTVIINHIGNREAAEALGNFIRCYYIVDEDIKPEDANVYTASDVDFTIILGKDFDGRYVRGGYTGEDKTEN